VGKALLAAAVCLSPILDSLPGIGGFSLAWIVYAALAIWVITRLPNALLRTVKEPLFLSAALFLVVGGFVEALHTNRDFEVLTRFVQTVAGALLIASLCRTKETLTFALRSLVWFACCVSLILITTSYRQLRAVDVEDFEGASGLRDQVFAASDLFSDLNRWSFVCGLGAPVALAILSRTSDKRKKSLWTIASITCLLGATLPLSRSGIVVTLGACSAVLAFTRGNRMRLSVAAVGILVCVYVFAPSALIQRFKGSGGFSSESQDPRQRILVASVKSIPEYWFFGVGAGNYWDSWAKAKEIKNKRGGARGAHNSFFQVWMYWGLPGLLSFLLLLWSAWRCLPRAVGRDPWALCLMGLFVAVILRSLFMHAFYVKDFSGVLGLLAAGRLWIWPTGRILPLRFQAAPGRLSSSTTTGRLTPQIVRPQSPPAVRFQTPLRR
jgi:hypothetical protein